MTSSLDALFHPRAIAVLGASRRRDAIGAEIFHNLVATGFQGAVYPVNPSAGSVQSVRAYRSVREIPEPVDLAVLAVPKERVLEAVDDCAAKGVKALVVITAGFGETGPAGRAREDELLRRVRAAGMRMVGPNCLGLLSTDPAVKLNATFAPTWPPEGNVALSSQSGAVGLAILDYARQLGIGISEFVSVGNKADVSGNDLLEHWESDPRTDVILFYLESFGNPRRFVEIARRVSRRKPIVAVKSGRTTAGARATSSHTGALAGSDVAVDALLGQAGVLRTDTIEELFDVARLLALEPVPKGPRVAIVTNAGGPAIMAADACESHGLELPALSPATEAALRAFLPPEASVRNPVDMIASAKADAFERAIPALLTDESVDALMVLFVRPVGTDAVSIAEAVRRATVSAKKPVLASFMGVHDVPEACDVLRAAGIPTYDFPEAGALALARAVRYGRWQARPEGTTPTFEGIDLERARRALGIADPEPGRWLDADEVRELLAAYGIRAPRTEIATSVEDAVRAAAAIGFPVAMKIRSPTILHKSDVGGVALGLRNEREVREAHEAMRARLASIGRLQEMTGVVVQEMAGGGVETFLGVSRAPAFGALLAFGIGGTAVELWRDVVFRVHPIHDVDAREMLGEIRGVKLLDGFRGAPPADREAIVDAILRVNRMLTDFPEIAEMDVNPLVARAPGEGVIAIDARVRVSAP